MNLSECCKAFVKVVDYHYECKVCGSMCNVIDVDVLKENTTIKITNLSHRIWAKKDNFSIEAEINSEGKITIYNNKEVRHSCTHENREFKFIKSTPNTVRAIGELLISVSEYKVK